MPRTETNAGLLWYNLLTKNLATMKTENQKKVKALLKEKMYKLIRGVKRECITKDDAGSAMLYLMNRATKEESKLLDEIWKELPDGGNLYSVKTYKRPLETMHFCMN